MDFRSGEDRTLVTLFLLMLDELFIHDHSIFYTAWRRFQYTCGVENAVDGDDPSREVVPQHDRFQQARADENPEIQGSERCDFQAP